MVLRCHSSSLINTLGWILCAGIGVRVETNENGDFVIHHVHRNGAAERDGNVKVGDVIDAIDGRAVYGLKLAELGVSPSH